MRSYVVCHWVCYVVYEIYQCISTIYAYDIKTYIHIDYQSNVCIGYRQTKYTTLKKVLWAIVLRLLSNGGVNIDRWLTDYWVQY